MNEKKPSLEAFVERHRADFDAFEPRPDLWDAIEHDLVVPAAAAETPLRVVRLAAETTPSPRPRFRSYRLVAALALLVLAGGGFFWKNTAMPRPAAWTHTGLGPLMLQTSSTPAYLDALPEAIAAADAPAQRLPLAVRRMEAYYAVQLADREAELRQLDDALPTSPATDWQHELTTLDSTYQQLRVELYRHPQPDVVFDAMNRNLQIRLDILNQQVRTREQVEACHAGSPMLADSYRMP